jgi:type IV secretion system protein VirB3
VDERALPQEIVLNGMRRPATIFGTHIGAVIGTTVFTLYAYQLSGVLWVLLVCLPIHAICWLITKADPFAFRLVGLKLGHAVETLPNRLYWGASSRDPNGRRVRRRHRG